LTLIPLIPAGQRVHIEITFAEKKVSGSGNPMVNIRCKILDTYDLEDGEFFIGSLLFSFLMMRERNMRDQEAFKNFLIALGYAPHGMQNVRMKDLIGLSCDAIVNIQTSTEIDKQTGEVYQDKNGIKRFMRVDLSDD
jgi:hypothetical protein